MPFKRKLGSKRSKWLQRFKRLKVSSDDPDLKPTVTDDNSSDSDEFFDAVKVEDTEYFECSDQPLSSTSPPAPSSWTDTIFSRLPGISSTTFDFRHLIWGNNTMQSQAENGLHLTTDGRFNASGMKNPSQPSRPFVEELKPSSSRSLLPRGVDITVATSGYISTVAGLVDELWSVKRKNPMLIKSIKTVQIPYSGLDDFTFTERVDVLILCHSVENRRFAITDVVDSLYDDFLEYCERSFGKNNLIVIVHDFPPEREDLRQIKMATFQTRQPTTFASAGLVMICGQLVTTCELTTVDKDHLVRYLQAAARLPLGGTIYGMSTTSQLPKMCFQM